MKMEHKEIIDRARLHGIFPSVLAHQLLVHDLVEAALSELRSIHAPYNKLNEGQQQEVIERITDRAKEAVSHAVSIISSRNVTTIPCKMKQIQVTEKTLTVTSLVDAKDPSRHGLTDSAGHLCLLVLAPDDYQDGLDFIQPDRDQPDLLHGTDANDDLFDLPEPQDRVEPPGSSPETGVPEFQGREFGDFSYDDAAQLVVLHGDVIDVTWLQRRLAIDSDSATNLLLRLQEHQVIEFKADAEHSIDYTYQVVAKLEDLSLNLNVE